MNTEESKRIIYVDKSLDFEMYIKAVCRKCGKMFPLDYDTMRIGYDCYSNDPEIKIKCPHCGDLYTQ